MTREEAIEMVRAAFDVWESEFDTGNDWSKEHMARDMAIKALTDNSYELWKESYEVERTRRIWCEEKIKELENILDEVKTEIRIEEKWLAQAGYNAHNTDIAFFSIKHVLRKGGDK